MIIDWKKYVDQIYCITFPNKQMNELYAELKRVDILDSGIYREFENISSPLFKKMFLGTFGSLKEEYPMQQRYSYAYDVTIAHYYCMKHAEQNNYDRILILENDNIFLKDKKDIINILDNAFKNCDDNGFIFLGAAVHSIYNYPEILQNHNIRNTSYQCTETVNYNILKIEDTVALTGGASFNIYDKIAYKEFIKFIEDGNYWTVDIYNEIYDTNKIKIYISDTYIAIQNCWIGTFLNSLNNYNCNQFYKYMYLMNIINDYNSIKSGSNPSDIISDTWASELAFNQLNEKFFNYELDITKYLT